MAEGPDHRDTGAARALTIADAHARRAGGASLYTVVHWTLQDGATVAGGPLAPAPQTGGVVIVRRARGLVDTVPLAADADGAAAAADAAVDVAEAEGMACQAAPGEAPRWFVRDEGAEPAIADVLTCRGYQKDFGEFAMVAGTRELAERTPPLPRGFTEATWSDDLAPAFHAAYTAGFSTRPGFTPTPFDTWIARMRSEPDQFPGATRVVIGPDGDPVACAICDLPDVPAAWRSGWVRQVCTAPGMRGRGIATRLIGLAAAAFADTALDHVMLHVNETNPYARALYERLGFRECGHRVRYSRPSSA